MKKQKEGKLKYRTFIKIIEKNKSTQIDASGRILYPVKWIEIFDDINLGSIKHPNKDILEIKIVPIKEDKKGVNQDFDGFLKRFGFGGFTE